MLVEAPVALLSSAQIEFLVGIGVMARAGGQAPGGRGADAPQSAPPGPVAATASKTETAVQTQVLEDRRKAFKQARAHWVSVKKQAEADIELVKAGVRKAYRADPVQFPKVIAGCKAIDAILDMLDDELRDTLDQYASTPLRAQDKLAALASSADAVLDRYQRYVDSDPLLKAIDLKEFADVQVHAPVSKALRDLRKALS